MLPPFDFNPKNLAVSGGGTFVEKSGEYGRGATRGGSRSIAHPAAPDLQYFLSRPEKQAGA
jgi:hypothetical protein